MKLLVVKIKLIEIVILQKEQQYYTVESNFQTDINYVQTTVGYNYLIINLELQNAIYLFQEDPKENDSQHLGVYLRHSTHQ